MESNKSFRKQVSERTPELMGSFFIMSSFAMGAIGIPKIQKHLADGRYFHATLSAAGLMGGGRFLGLAMNGFVDSLLKSDRKSWGKIHSGTDESKAEQE